MAFRVGIHLAEFWTLTPWHLNIMVEAHSRNSESQHKTQLGVAWYTAAFTRARNLPSLKEILGTKKTQSKKIDEDVIIASFREYQRRRDEGDHGDGSRD